MTEAIILRFSFDFNPNVNDTSLSLSLVDQGKQQTTEADYAGNIVSGGRYDRLPLQEDLERWLAGDMINAGDYPMRLQLWDPMQAGDMMQTTGALLGVDPNVTRDVTTMVEGLAIDEKATIHAFDHLCARDNGFSKVVDATLNLPQIQGPAMGEGQSQS